AVSELYADQRAKGGQLQSAYGPAGDTFWENVGEWWCGGPYGHELSARRGYRVVAKGAGDGAPGSEAAGGGGAAGVDVVPERQREALGIERRCQARVIHDLFGNPFRRAHTIGPTVLAWNDRTVVRLAQSAYEERSLPDGTLDLTRLAVLADALEDA